MLSRLKEKFFSFSLVVVQLAATLFLFTFLFRFVEISVFGCRGFLPVGSFRNFLLGIAGDIAAICYYMVVLFLPFFLLFLLSEAISKLLLRIAFTLLIIFELLLTIYFLISQILLDDAFYNYSFADLKFIIETAGLSFRLVITGVILVFILLFFLGNRISRKIQPSILFRKAFLPLAILITLLHQSIIVLAVNGDFGLSMQVNKSFFFFNRSIRYFSKSPISSKQLKKEIALFQKLHPREYIGTEYPLEIKNNYPDVLSPFFQKGVSKPNLVFIIVEGLGKCFSGPNALYGSFTPFLDSLAKQSLYFPNFLSTSERTVCVLPSLLGSLPYGKRGFTKLIEEAKYPRHLSLLKILKANNYYTSFHYGGWIHFSNYDDFMLEQGVDNMSNENESKDFAWGLSDDSLYIKSFYILDSAENPQPRADAYLTLSMHHPFKIPNQEFYLQKLFEHLESVPLTTAKKEELKRYKLNLASVLFSDDALKMFFHEYSGRPEFSNTIFFLTGDHAMPEIALNDGFLNCYNVPLLVYSPMLKIKKTIEAVSSHLDLTPSILAFLNTNYGLSVPDTVHWLGDGLDTASLYRNIHNLAFMHNSTDMVDYISENYFLDNGRAYNISEGLVHKTEVRSPNVLSGLQHKLENFKLINDYVCSSDKIIKPQIANAYQRDKNFISLPVKTVFNFNANSDTIIYSLKNFELKNLRNNLVMHYSFNYKLNSTFAAQNPSIVFLLTDKEGSVIRNEERLFNINDSRKGEAYNGIPVDGVCSVSLSYIDKADNNLRLSIFFKRKPKETGVINNLRITTNTY
jgi:phosphoglycerol transferase MdoB-like AlkP superfamily enzyme